MISPATYYRIQHEFHEEHRKVSAIARRLNLANQTVAKWVLRADYAKPMRCRRSKLDAFKPTILRMLELEGLSVMQTYTFLRAQGYGGGYSALKDFVKRNLSRFRVSRREFAIHRWLNRVMQGYFSVSELQNQLAAKLAAEEVVEFAAHVRNGSLPERNKAVAVLAFGKGISSQLLASFLLVSNATVCAWRKRFRCQGADALMAHRPAKAKKSDRPEINDAVFAILHAPPSAYGFNRTSWRMVDITRALRKNGVALCKDGVLEIIRKAGYEFRKAKRVLTSNDPDYREKLQEITNILRNLKPDYTAHEN